MAEVQRATSPISPPHWKGEEEGTNFKFNGYYSRRRKALPAAAKIQTAMASATRTAMTSLLIHSVTPLVTRRPFGPKLRLSPLVVAFSTKEPLPSRRLACKDKSRYLRTLLACDATRQKAPTTAADDESVRRVLQFILWVAEGIYILWLFLLPYAPGDPVWAISSDTVNSLVGLSLNFFFILPLMNSVGIRLIDAPVLHPMAEGLFNFVIGWTFMFAPLLFTDCRRDRYKGSLDILWGFQMFLTNTFLIPYMAIRLNESDAESTPRKSSQLGSLMTNGAPLVGLIGGAICLISALWALFGRPDGDFGGLMDRLGFLVSYLGSERLAYAFIWDVCLYIIFQPWLIGDNMQNVQKSKVDLVKYSRFVPVVGLAVYLLCLNVDEQL